MEKKSALASLTSYRDSDISDDDDDLQSDNQVESLHSSPQKVGTNDFEKRGPVPVVARGHLVSYNEEDLDKEEATSPTNMGQDLDAIILDDNVSQTADDDMSLENQEIEQSNKTENSSLPIPNDVKLPPEPQVRCANHLQEKIAKCYAKILDGNDMNSVIQNQKLFRNPSIYEKLISFCAIDELGTNCPPEVYDPHIWGEESLYEELAKFQKAEMDKRQKEKGTKVEFVSGTKRPGMDLPIEEKKKRKSKWDMVATASNQPVPVIKQAGILQNIPTSVIPVTTATLSTKPTVISAFGTISKKPKV